MIAIYSITRNFSNSAIVTMPLPIRAPVTMVSHDAPASMLVEMTRARGVRFIPIIQMFPSVWFHPENYVEAVCG